MEAKYSEPCQYFGPQFRFHVRLLVKWRAVDSLAKILAHPVFVGSAQTESKLLLIYRCILLYVCWLPCLRAAVLASVEFGGQAVV